MPDPVDSAACCLVHQLGKCDAVFTCCDRCPTFFADRASPVTVRSRRRADNNGPISPAPVQEVGLKSTQQNSGSSAGVGDSVCIHLHLTSGCPPMECLDCGVVLPAVLS